jgi:hypothetical protein
MWPTTPRPASSSKLAAVDPPAQGIDGRWPVASDVGLGLHEKAARSLQRDLLPGERIPAW